MTFSKSNLIVYKKQFSCQVTARGEQYQTYKCSKSRFFFKAEYSVMLEPPTLMLESCTGYWLLLWNSLLTLLLAFTK